MHTFVAYYDRDKTHYMQFIHGETVLLLPFDTNWVSLELMIFSGPRRIGIVTDINNAIRHHKINYSNNYVKLDINENVTKFNGIKIILKNYSLTDIIK